MQSELGFQESHMAVTGRGQCPRHVYSRKEGSREPGSALRGPRPVQEVPADLFAQGWTKPLPTSGGCGFVFLLEAGPALSLAGGGGPLATSSLLSVPSSLEGNCEPRLQPTGPAGPAATF